MNDETAQPDEAHERGFPSIAGVGYWTLSLASETMRWSPELSRLYNLPHVDEPPLGYGSTRIAGEHWDDVHQAFLDCTEAGIPYDIEIELELDDGIRRWVRLIGEPVRNSVGDIIGARGAVQDIDHHRRAANSWRRKALILEQVAVARGDIVLLLSWDGKLVYATAESLRVTTFDAYDLIEELGAQLPGHEDQSLEERLAECAAPGEIVEIELHLDQSIAAKLHPAPDGLIVHLEAVTPEPDEPMSLS